MNISCCKDIRLQNNTIENYQLVVNVDKFSDNISVKNNSEISYFFVTSQAIS